jgi:transketolase
MIDKHLNRYENQVLDKRSLYLRKLVIRAFEGGSRGHLGSSMSLIEILRVLYDSFLNYKVKMPEWEDRDRFILSKGHGCLAQYALLADKGFIKLTDLDFFCHLDGILGGHPEHSKIPGIEASTGALGHGLSIGVGMAVSAKINHKRHKIIVVTGDGEINEGSIWEAAMSASQNKLDNLIWIIDYNKLQSYGETKEIINLEPLNDKISSFGFNVNETDGHNTKMIEEALTNTNLDNGNPSAIICHTVKGKGFPFAEHNPDWHHKAKLGIDVIQKMKECLND